MFVPLSCPRCKEAWVEEVPQRLYVALCPKCKLFLGVDDGKIVESVDPFERPPNPPIMPGDRFFSRFTGDFRSHVVSVGEEVVMSNGEVFPRDVLNWDWSGYNSWFVVPDHYCKKAGYDPKVWWDRAKKMREAHETSG